MIILLLFLSPIIGCRSESKPTVETPERTEKSERDATNAENQPADNTAHASFYTVSTYDEKANPADHFAATVSRAEKENKRILLQVGGDWCVWCARIADYMTNTPSVRETLDKRFVVMKVTYPGEYAEEFLSTYPKCEGYPHLFVLDQNGELLHSQGTSELEEGESYDEEVFLSFLKKWQG